MRLVYSTKAVADLERLRKFIAEHDPGAAARVAAQLLERLDHLRLFPGMGHRVPLAPEPADIRDMTFGKYIVRYSVHADVVIVLRVWHHYEYRPAAS